jgi:hypothetical protein
MAAEVQHCFLLIYIQLVDLLLFADYLMVCAIDRCVICMTLCNSNGLYVLGTDCMYKSRLCVCTDCMYKSRTVCMLSVITKFED